MMNAITATIEMITRISVIDICYGLKNSFIASFRLNTSTVNFPSTLRTTLPEKASLSVHIRQQKTFPLSDGLMYLPVRLWNMNSGSLRLQLKHFFIHPPSLTTDTVHGRGHGIGLLSNQLAPHCIVPDKNLYHRMDRHKIEGRLYPGIQVIEIYTPRPQ